MRNDIKVIYFSDIIGRFDKDKGKIYGVSVITEGKAKGHELTVDSQTLMEIKKAAESFPDGRLKTKLNHRTGVEAVFGYLENFRVEGPKLLADLKMLKSHKDFAQTFEQIESLPNQLGLSVAFVGKEERSPTGDKLARCREILSADLVPEPAANPTGMFEQKTDALVDTEKLVTMNDPIIDAGGQVQGAGAQGAQGSQGEQTQPTLQDILSFLQDQVLPRIEATEQFQAAVEAELAANTEIEVDENGNPIEKGDLGVRSHEGGPVDNRDGGTRAGAMSSPSNQGVQGQVQGQRQEQLAPAQFSQLRDAVINLERRINAKEDAERETQLESALNVIKNKTEKLTEYATKLEKENVVLLEALKTGVKPVKTSPNDIFLDTGKSDDFQTLVKKHADAGKSKTEAVLLARKENPNAHLVWLQNQGVVTTL